MGTDPAADALGEPRGGGRAGRLDVWYATCTGADGTGYWLHYETVAPTAGAAPYAHGWAAVFPSDRHPTVARFGPVPASDPAPGRWFRAAGAEVAPGRLLGTAGPLRWDLAFTDPGPPLFTFPRFAWERELLPGAQVVPWPRAHITGAFTVDGDRHEVDAVGGVARIHGHGNAHQWCWLHADLGAGAVLEVVSATPRLGALRRLPPVAMVQLRVPGDPDWPARPLLAGLRFRTRLGRRSFSVHGGLGGRRLRVEVRLPEDRTVSLSYRDPDGATATCTNSERADATVVLERRDGGWRTDRAWTLSGTAHAEIGHRP